MTPALKWVDEMNLYFNSQYTVKRIRFGFLELLNPWWDADLVGFMILFLPILIIMFIVVVL